MQGNLILDTDDINYLVQSFTIPQLRHELHHAEVEYAVCRQLGDKYSTYYRDYAEACQLAIDIQRWLQPKPSPRGNSKGLINIEDLKARTDIVEVASRYTTLKKSGKRFTGLCPLHNEKHPSFVVYPNEQRWHCFGACSTGGDVIGFVMKTENISFGDALHLLGERVGIGRQARQKQKPKKISGGTRRIEEYCLALLLQHPELSANGLLAEYFINSENREVFYNLMQGKELDSALGEHYDHLLELKLSTEKLEERLTDCILRLRERYLRALAMKQTDASEVSRQLKDVLVQQRQLRRL